MRAATQTLDFMLGLIPASGRVRLAGYSLLMQARNGHAGLVGVGALARYGPLPSSVTVSRACGQINTERPGKRRLQTGRDTERHEAAGIAG